ncbi:PREDICTED: cathepsin L1-like isoform X1 [Branchiostoma belcheri]|uniref:Cathepsin L1-like isoform X1 n=1 Tax=Branchiostoma belcheri TaxID=7741 RepID=A0A6P4YNR2_BRABE|nr:PREDICTED: cathepsin L1-like isoform X1 [Branchiostoma belcheri]XP_019623315.1 PREDICTED: cathepsin L1-like isoform X1 [Branchiostoma belcheri]XP_019623316.1 PREDICTED: cathepsin L1-like isoform X1 [Branchiostoma belcheri]
MMLLVLAAVISMATAGVLPHNKEWEMWKLQHGKQYATEAEEYSRRFIFEKNTIKIAEHNIRASLGMHSYTLAMNKFGDMHHEEFHQRIMGGCLKIVKVNKPLLGSELKDDDDNGTLPKSVDWRNSHMVSEVKDQGECGSCWAFSTTGSLEGQHANKTGQLVDLSEQQLVDCSKDFGNQGCGGGLMDQAFQYIKANGGLDTEESYPYTATDDKPCKFDNSSVGATLVGYKDVKSGNEHALKRAVATVGPISVAIDAGHESFQFYSSGVYDEPQCSTEQLDHGVLVVGYGAMNDNSHQAFWIVKNSWGPNWGDQGYIMMSRNKDNQCGIATSASYPLV